MASATPGYKALPVQDGRCTCGRKPADRKEILLDEPEFFAERFTCLQYTSTYATLVSMLWSKPTDFQSVSL